MSKLAALSKYPTPWQRKVMWAALTALFLVFLVLTAGSLLWIAGNVIGFLQPILIPVAIAGILAYLLDPLVTRMSRRGLGRTKAIILLFAVAFLAIAGLLAWLVPVISMQSASLARELPDYSRRARETVVDFIYRYDRTFGMPGGTRDKSSATTSFVDWLLAPPAAKPTPTPKHRAVASPSPFAQGPTFSEPKEKTPATPAKLTTAERQHIREWVERQLPSLQNQLPYLTDKFWQLVQKSVGGFLGATGFLLSLIMVPIYLFFLLKEGPAIRRRWKEYLPLRASPLKEEVAAVLTQINSYIIAYFRGQLLVCLVDGLLIAAALMAIGLNFAPLIGLLVVVLTMIPYIGIVLCWIPAVLIAAVQWGDWTHPLIVTAIFIVIQNLEAIFYAPRIVGNSVGLHPMTVIVSIFVWGLLIGGLLGPILAVPLTATLKVLLARYVWGRRLRDEVMENIEQVPVVRESETIAPA
jgi:predicted PurR-regulated permease PerM